MVNLMQCNHNTRIEMTDAAIELLKAANHAKDTEELKYTLETISERLMEIDAETTPEYISEYSKYQSA